MTLAETLHQIRMRNIAVVKNGKAPKHRYATMADVMGALAPVLREFEVSVWFESGAAAADGALCAADETLLSLKVSNGKETIFHTFTCKIPEPILNSQGASVVNLPMRAAGGKTHARRTELILFFNLFTGEDNEVERFCEIAGDDVEPRTGMQGALTVTADAKWTTLYDRGMWANCAGPAGVGALGHYASQHGVAAMFKLVDSNPGHAALLAWLGAYCTNRINRCKLSWGDLSKATGLPESMEECSGEELRTAAEYLRTNFAEKPDAK